MAATPMTAQQAYQKALQQNAQARAAVLAYGVKRIQQIQNTVVAPIAAQPTVITIVPQNVGLIQGFIVEVNGNIINSGAGVLTRTELGSACALSNVLFSDLSNQIRHNCPGWLFHTVNSAKQGWVWGGAYQPNVPQDYSAYNTSFANTNLVVPNWNVRSAPVSIANAANNNIREMYYIPLAYSATDLRGSIYAGVTNATMNLQLTLAAQPVAQGGADATQAIYSGTAGAWNGNVTVTVYQVYYDQLPVADVGNGQKQVVIPQLDIQQQYCLLQTSISGIVVGQDFPYAYANFRNFMSTTVIYDNNGVNNAGSDVNYWALTSANNTNIFKFTPEIAALLARQQFLADLPKGMYYFDHRQNPIATNQFGNYNLNGNFSTANAPASLLVGVEYFQQQNVQGAQSLAAS